MPASGGVDFSELPALDELPPEQRGVRGRAVVGSRRAVVDEVVPRRPAVEDEFARLGPALGNISLNYLPPLVVADLVTHLRELNASRGIAVLLIEQNAQMALNAARRGYVIETGEIVLEDDAAKLLGNDQVRKAYLGEE